MSEENTGWVNSDGTFGDLSAAPESVQTMIESKGFTNVSDFATMASNLEGMKGDWANPASMKLPDSFTDEQMTTIHGKLGAPDSADGYTYEFAEGANIDEGLFGKFKEFAAGSHMSQDMFKGTLDLYESIAKDGNETYQNELKSLLTEGENKLREKHGDSYDDIVSKADSFAEKSGLGKALELYGIDKNPGIRDALYELSQTMEEGKLPGAEITTTLTKEEEIKELTGNPAYTNNMHPDHKAVVAKVNKLYGLTG